MGRARTGRGGLHARWGAATGKREDDSRAFPGARETSGKGARPRIDGDLRPVGGLP